MPTFAACRVWERCGKGCDLWHVWPFQTTNDLNDHCESTMLYRAITHVHQLIIIHTCTLLQGAREPDGPVDRQRARADAQVRCLAHVHILWIFLWWTIMYGNFQTSFVDGHHFETTHIQDDLIPLQNVCCITLTEESLLSGCTCSSSITFVFQTPSNSSSALECMRRGVW